MEIFIIVLCVVLIAIVVWLVLQNNHLRDEASSLRVDKAVCENRLHEMEQSASRTETALQQQLALVREQMLNTTNEMLKNRQAELNAQNKDQIGAILSPLQSEIRQMKEAVDKSKEASNQTQSVLKTQIDMLMRQSMDIGNKADSLARALTAENKTQGNFGEIKLSELLESMELEKGIHFDVQEALRDENGETIVSSDGHRLIPDVTLHFTDNRDAIIDSKMSITAYENYVNATTEEERQNALKEHIASVRKHVDELSKKNYNNCIKPGRQKLAYVIMYMYCESALQLALCNDTGLWKYAFDKNVFITGSQNLYAILRLTKESWTIVEQTRNQEKIMQHANSIIHRTQLFAGRLRKLGKTISELQGDYDSLKKTTSDNGQSIVVAARMLLDLGAKEAKGKNTPPLPINELIDDEDSSGN